MNIKKNYPDYAAIEAQIHRARVERAIVVSQGIINFAEATVRMAKTIGQAVAAGINRRRAATLPKATLAEY